MKHLLGQVPFITNAQDEVKKVSKQKEENMKLQQQAFSMTSFQQTGDVTDNAGDSTLN